MRRLFALFIAGALAATSVAAADSCPAMRAKALKRCCCPPSSPGHARLTCCETKTVAASATVVRDRHDQPPVVAAPATALWTFVSVAPAHFSALPAQAVIASAAGPPPVPLLI
jgi:hypothetical protein